MSELFEREWPVDGASGAVVIVHGLGEHSGRYEHVAQALNEAGYSAYAKDSRGHGKSIGAPGDMGTDAGQIVDDAVDLIKTVAQSYDRVFVLGHSMGTLISLSAVAALPDGALAGLVLSGCALEPGEAGGELVTNGAVPPDTLSRDPEVVRAYTDDPLVWDSVPTEALMRVLELGQRAGEAVAAISVPVLLIHGSDDKLCDISGSSSAYDQLTVEDKTFKSYEGLRHEVLNEPEKDQVITDVIAWLDVRS
jgi:acylglycerol lipase